VDRATRTNDTTCWKQSAKSRAYENVVPKTRDREWVKDVFKLARLGRKGCKTWIN